MKLTLTCAIATFALIAASAAYADILDECMQAEGEANAIALCTKAIAAITDAEDLAIAYSTRGCTYLILGKRAQGLKDFETAKRLDAMVVDHFSGGEDCK